MVFCTYCGSSFNRNEHLQRHVLIHTKVRPFKCAICHLSFTRRDLVRKHYKVHTDREVARFDRAIAESLQIDPTAQGLSVAGGRVARACISCANSKTKCNQESPCFRCKTKGISCVFRESRANANDSIVLEVPIGVADDYEEPPAEGPELDHEEMYPQSPGTNGVPMTRSNAVQTLGKDAESTLCDTPNLDILTNEAVVVQTDSPHCADNTQATFIPEIVPLNSDVSNAGVESFHILRANLQRPVPLSGPSNNPLTAAPAAQDTIDQGTFGDPGWFLSSLGTESVRLDPSSIPGYAFDGVFSLHTEENAWQATFPSAETLLSQCFLDFEEHSPTDAVFCPSPDDTGSNQSSDQGASTAAWSESYSAAPSAAVLLEQEMNQWPLAQCTPLLGSKHASSSQDGFSVRQCYTDTTTWSFAVERYRDTCFEPHERIENVDLTDETRDWLLIEAQHFVRVEYETQKSQKLSEGFEPPLRGSENTLGRFFPLPPKTPLQKYLDIYLTTFEPFVPMIPALSLNPNKLASRKSERKSTLLLLLMIAFGSMIDPAPRARDFSHKLTEVCWHSLRHLTIGLNTTKQDNLILHCSLLFTIQACFSGRGSHMEAGIAHYHLCLGMMKGSTQFRNQRFQDVQQPDGQRSLDQQWRMWIDNEVVSRLLYNWVIADQEISLFYDTAPMLLPSELKAYLPADESVWMAPNAQEWKAALDATQREGQTRTKVSLCELFSLFSDNRLDDFPRSLNIMDVRLLLHPLHSLVFNYRQVISILGSRSGSSIASSGRSRVRPSSSDTFSDIHHLIRHWFAIYDAVDIQGTRLATVARAVVMQYHVISIDLFCSIKQCEFFARRETPEAATDLALEIQEDIGKHAPELLAHCGQILRHTHESDVKLRPIWWSLAVYRASLVLWVYCVTRLLLDAKLERKRRAVGPKIALDTVCFSHPSISHYILYETGTPQLAAGKGEPVDVDRPGQVLGKCIEAFGSGPRQWRLARALQCKLKSLAEIWHDVY